ncbi:hypothetical protein HanIR_Chr11g0546391 [Helianthus annuus]|nr:hypothetical protein HanIR_Chr11g0546391 [Helianthus annuus]
MMSTSWWRLMIKYRAPFEMERIWAFLRKSSNWDLIATIQPPKSKSKRSKTTSSVKPKSSQATLDAHSHINPNELDLDDEIEEESELEPLVSLTGKDKSQVVRNKSRSSSSKSSMYNPIKFWLSKVWMNKSGLEKTNISRWTLLTFKKDYTGLSEHDQVFFKQRKQ